ncbi:hypothetical protein BGZ60DRAFT_383917 [Tricladium varicosporioides]|nr:hypothetical protein BGZ60DRAFT_383917 [Hymenoscyphus varicosporioides]
MASSATQNPVVKPESKSSKKKKAKSTSADIETSPAPAVETSTSNPTESNSGDGAYESPYIKELYKSIRNVNKKITNASKVDNIVAENPGKTLDALVAERRINADQKAQILKKPQLQASLAQLEEQIAQYKKFDQEYKAKSQAEKAEFEKTLAERSSKEIEEAVTAANVEAVSKARSEQENSLLLLSQFLRLAAIRRGDDENPELEENKALEGLLARVYGGDASAVASMNNLLNGSGEQIPSVNGDLLTTTYSEIKQLVLAQAVPLTPTEATGLAEETPAAETAEYPVQSDPTIANAGLTELDDPSTTVMTNGHHEAQEVKGIPQNSGIGEGAANAAAEAKWDTQNDLSTSQEWVEVPRDTTETDTGITAAPTAPPNTQSWADDAPDSPVETTSTPPVNKDDGFHEVQRSRGGNRDRGQFRGGRGPRGDYRGRGNFRGDGRGRGRGGARGPRPTES